MIVVDSSALIAILQSEDEDASFRAILSASPAVVMSAPTKIEVMMVAGGRYGQEGLAAAQTIFDQSGIVIQNWTEELSNQAIKAFMKYGKGRHFAKLNFGDCMSYALAKALNAPLLYKGDDFAKTDIIPAAMPSA